MKYFFKACFALLFVFNVHIITGQEYKNTITQYRVKLASGAREIIDTGDVVSADDMAPQVKVKGYGPVDVNLNKMKHKKLTPAEIYKKVSKSIVIVSPAGTCGKVSDKGECKSMHTYPASGYIIDSAGIIVTNYHVLNGYVTDKNTDSRDVLLVMLQDGTLFPVTKVLSADKANDLAILKIDPRGVELPALSVATTDAEIGDPVYIVSHPKKYFYAFSSGMVTDKFSNINAGQYRNLMAISADYAAGSSGSAIIDQFGNVIGTVSFTKTLKHSDDSPNIQMVLKATIPASSLLNLIKEGNMPKSKE